MITDLEQRLADPLIPDIMVAQTWNLNILLLIGILGMGEYYYYYCEPCMHSKQGLYTLQKEFSYFNHSFGHLSCQVAMSGGDSCNVLRFTISNFFIRVPFEITPNRTPVMDP